jgi:hypothetical protein
VISPEFLEQALPFALPLEMNFLAHGAEESLEGFDGSFSAYPEQAGDADVDLVDQGQVLVAFGVLDFIDANALI